MNKLSKSSLGAIALVTILLSSCAPPPEETPELTFGPVSISDHGATSSPSSPLISPDGTIVFYSHEDRIYTSNTDGTDVTPVTPEGQQASGARRLDDTLFYLAENDGETQLYRKTIGGAGKGTRVIGFPHGMSSTRVSPDQSRVVIAVSDNELIVPEDDAKPQPIVVTRRHFKRDSGHGYIVDGDQDHLHVMDLETGETRQLTFGRYDESQPSWSPDSSSLVFVSNREDEPDVGFRTDIWVLDVESEAAELRRLTDTTDAKWGPRFSPDGKSIAYQLKFDGPYGMSNIAVIPADGGEPVIVTRELDRWVSSFEWSDDSEWIYLRYQDSGAVNLARIRVADQHVEELIAGDQVVQSFDVAADGTLVAVIQGKLDAGDVYTLQGEDRSRVTDVNAEFFAARQLGEKTKVRIDSTDGMTIDVFITTPPNYEPGRAYPAILNLHGGPQSQFSWGYGFTSQLFASEGYVVVEPNPRGSTGRGQEFLEAIYRSWGVSDFDDVMAAADYAVAAGLADPDRLAVTGYSYGACLTNSAITRTNRFKAAVSGAGESHAEASFGHNMYTDWYVWELGVPWENRERYDVHAPFLRAGHVETPTLFMGGALDWNQPIQSSELFYQALRVRGIDTQLVVYPGVHHGGWGRDFEIDYLLRALDWFARYIDVDNETS